MAKTSPRVVVGARDRNPLVAATRGVQAVRRGESVAISGRRAHVVPFLQRHQRSAEHRNERFDLREIDVLSAPGPTARSERRQDGDDRVEACIRIGEPVLEAEERLAFISHARVDPAQAGQDGCVRPNRSEWTSSADGRNRDVDQRRVDLRQTCVVEPVLRKRTRTEVFDENVACGHELQEHAQRVLLVQVELD